MSASLVTGCSVYVGQGSIGLVTSVMVSARARPTHVTSNTTNRVHLPTLGLDGQVYVCMCMGRYSV